jgi:hypothetical protein
VTRSARPRADALGNRHRSGRCGPILLVTNKIAQTERDNKAHHGSVTTNLKYYCKMIVTEVLRYAPALPLPQRPPRSRHRVPPGSTLRALARGKTGGSYPRGQASHLFPVISDKRSVKRSARSGRTQPGVRNMRRNHGRHLLPGPGSEIMEKVQSTVDRQHPLKNRTSAERKPPPNAVRASPERSDTRAPINQPQAKPSQRAGASSGRGRRPTSFPILPDRKREILSDCCGYQDAIKML